MSRGASIASTFGAMILVLAGLVIGLFNERAYQAGRMQALTAQAEVLAATVEPAVVFFDRAAAAELVGALEADPQIDAVGVYDASGVKIAELGRAPARSAPPSGVGANLAPLARRHAVTAPIMHEGKAIGRVYLHSAPDPAVLVVQRHAGIALLMITAVLLVALARGARDSELRAAREAGLRADELARLNADLEQQVQRREAAEDALHQAQKMETLGQLTGGIAHDFNNLLQTVQGALDVISKRPDDLERVQRWSRIGLDAAERGARLTSQLLAFSRSQKLEMRPIDVGAVIHRLHELLPTVLGGGVEVQFQTDGDERPVVADAVQLELAVLNLCINARDAMPNGGRILVSVLSEHIEDDLELSPGPYLRLSVADNGVGMPADVKARAFDPFFTTKGVGKGTGLGLAQVYGIAKQSGGLARIESSAGRGTTVTILLPQILKGLQDDAPASATPDPEGGASARVLVIDDDEGVRAFICDVLDLNGYDCLAAKDGEAGLSLLARESVDLMVVDYAMPGMSGAEVAAAALALRPGLPIIIASGYAESAALEEALGRPVDLLRKPFDSSALLARVAKGLRERTPPVTPAQTPRR
jgi:signal transduction histidine kinase/ActR/RegA family two-component response regulator